VVEGEIVFEEEIEQFGHEVIGGGHGDEADAFFSVDAHAESDDVVREVKGGCAGGVDGAAAADFGE
jgi:hypothetical protein